MTFDTRRFSCLNGPNVDNIARSRKKDFAERLSFLRDIFTTSHMLSCMLVNTANTDASAPNRRTHRGVFSRLPLMTRGGYATRRLGISRRAQARYTYVYYNRAIFEIGRRKRAYYMRESLLAPRSLRAKAASSAKFPAADMTHAQLGHADYFASTSPMASIEAHRSSHSRRELACSSMLMLDARDNVARARPPRYA